MTIPNKGRAENGMPVAVVMNMFYTGLGIARSLGERGIRVIGLSAHRGVYGNFTRYAHVCSCPDSRENPQELLKFLFRLGDEIGAPAVIFPTRDDDVLFLDRFRLDLSSRFIPLLPSNPALMACLDKWETYLLAKKVGVPVPPTWKIERREDLPGILAQVQYPCVLKPLSAYYWRKPKNWKRVGARKAICVSSPKELTHEYELVAAADPRAIVQEVIPGGDDHLAVVACYFDRSSRVAANFTARKLLQVPERFGTGCIVQTSDHPELIPAAIRLLEELRFTGIAEVEFKWNPVLGEYQLIEINPRPWDQHRLGHASGVDLIHIAYCDLAGIAIPAVTNRKVPCKWIAEDVLFFALIRSLWKRDGRFAAVRHLAKGRKIYAIWSIEDPLPSIAYIPKRCLATVAVGAFHRFRSAFRQRLPNTPSLEQKTVL